MGFVTCFNLCAVVYLVYGKCFTVSTRFKRLNHVASPLYCADLFVGHDDHEYDDETNSFTGTGSHKVSIIQISKSVHDEK